jgi:uncharacterized phage infection (PIP) family protein YhgE
MTMKRTGLGNIAKRTAVVVLAAGISIVMAQAQETTGATAQGSGMTATSSASTNDTQTMQTPKEGFWGRINPFARKKWVRHQLQPIQGQVEELNGATAKNASDIKDVDQRAQAGISKAQSAADAANQTATAAGQQAQQAAGIAGQAAGKVGELQNTVSGIDQYAAKQSLTIDFKPGQETLTAAQKQQLDDLAQSIQSKQGYLLEMTAHAPGAGSYGIRNSQRLDEMVERYLVTAHNLPIYRMHAVALGNATDADASGAKRVTRSVEVRLMENTLAVMSGPTPR